MSDMSAEYVRYGAGVPALGAQQEGKPAKPHHLLSRLGNAVDRITGAAFAFLFFCALITPHLAKLPHTGLWWWPGN